ncbi:MAG TPA: hypothetical protein PKY12_05640 [Catalimonadaceae bacterium]|jgi:hypothetical protein|nr:hypothetical protein [Catalimonadaceae bacterium]
MRSLRFLFLSLIAVGFFSCEEENVHFLEPQPVGIDADTEIRKRFTGTYFNDSDSSYLIVSSDRIVFKPFSINVVIDSGAVSSKDGKVDLSLSSGDSKSRLNMELTKNGEEDSLLLNAEAEDEIFNLKKGGIAKLHRGYYFLNSPFEEGAGYRVRIMKLTKEGIILSKIASDSVLHLIENEEFVKKEPRGEDEEENWKLNPSRKQLKKLIKMGLFSEIIEFRRVNK